MPPDCRMRLKAGILWAGMLWTVSFSENFLAARIPPRQRAGGVFETPADGNPFRQNTVNVSGGHRCWHHSGKLEAAGAALSSVRHGALRSTALPSPVRVRCQTTP